MLLAVSDSAWGFLGVLVTAFASMFVALITLLIRQQKARVSIEEISRAVNHQGEDAPTLIARVVGIEERTELIERETHRHRQWEHRVFQALAHHVGFPLPQREDHHEYDQSA